ncbi:hypothetical protein TcasGA2_TC016100 [Tribolium castaneum]|uniref:CCHC-type domain-containing protein n=1 Tax=Tribolium castaneum TaxID=7070 RepID=D7GY56_TRICA|nr:hypothetical protein TcasGA2_TC016100 [Tribolium castaneum]
MSGSQPSIHDDDDHHREGENPRPELNRQGGDGTAGGPLGSAAPASHLIPTYSGSSNRLKAALIHRFEKKILAVDALHQFRKCKQRVGETVTELAERLQMLGAATIKRTGDQARDRWARANLQTECLQQFLEGLAMPVQQRVMSSSPKAVEKALLQEQIEDRLKKKTMQREIDAEERTESSHSQQQVQRRSYQSKKYRQITCFDCGARGHLKSQQELQSDNNPSQPQVSDFDVPRDPRNTVNLKEQLNDREDNLVDIIENVQFDFDVSRDPRNTVNRKEQHNDLEDNFAVTNGEIRFDLNVPKYPRTTVIRKEQLNGPEDNLVGTSKVTRFSIIAPKDPRTTVIHKDQHNGPEDNLVGT